MKIVKYGAKAFCLRTCLSILEESCPSFRVLLLSLLNQPASAALAREHKEWDRQQEMQRSYRTQPDVKRNRIERKWHQRTSYKATKGASTSTISSATQYLTESQRASRKRKRKPTSKGPLLYPDVGTQAHRRIYEREEDDVFAFRSDDEDMAAPLPSLRLPLRRVTWSSNDDESEETEIEESEESESSADD
jgi:hypothetical protein